MKLPIAAAVLIATLSACDPAVTPAAASLATPQEATHKLVEYGVDSDYTLVVKKPAEALRINLDARGSYPVITYVGGVQPGREPSCVEIEQPYSYKNAFYYNYQCDFGNVPQGTAINMVVQGKDLSVRPYFTLVGVPKTLEAAFTEPP